MTMTRSFLKLLMVASALVPVAAEAQRQGGDAQVSAEARSDRGDRGDRGDRSNRPERGSRQSDARQDAARPNDQAFQQQRQPRDDRPADLDQPQRADAIAQTRGDRNDSRGRQDWNGQERPSFDRGNQQVDRGQANRGQYDRDNGRDGYRNRQPNRAYGTTQGYGRGDYGQRGYNQGRYNQGGYNQGGYNRGGAWNRGWRNDDRYAWNDYRTSHRGAYRLPRYYAPNGWGSGYRRFGVGFSLNSILYNQNYWIQDPYTYRLPEAYGPYRWVRYYNDALLVDLDSGRVVDTVYDIFW